MARELGFTGTFVESAFLGSIDVRVVENLAKTIDTGRFLKPIDDPDKRRIKTAAAEIVTKMVTGVDSVARLQEIVADDTTTIENREIAMETIDILGKAVYMVMRYGDENDLQVALGEGIADATKIEDKLPEPFKGLGERVAENMFDENSPVVQIMRGLDRQSKRLSGVRADGVRAGQMLSEMKRAFESLVCVDSGSEKEELGVLTALAYLANRIEEVHGYIGLDTRGDPGLTREPVEMSQNDMVSAYSGILSEMGRVPEGKEAQLAYIRPILERVESVKGPVESNPSLRAVVDAMEQRMGEMLPEVRKEGLARLSIHFCAQLMRQANGVLESKGGMTMGQAAFTAEYFGREPNSDVLEFLFKGDSNGLDVAGAWDLIQKASFGGGDEDMGYVALLREMTQPANVQIMKARFGDFGVDRVWSGLETYQDNDPTTGVDIEKVQKVFCTDSGYRKEWARYFLAVKLAKENKGFGFENEDEARRHAMKTITIAENAQLAFGETNVANAGGLVGVDDLAELIGLIRYLGGKIPRTPAGPAYIFGLVRTIPGATGWLRRKVEDFGNEEPLLVADMRGYKKEKPWESVSFGDYSFHNMVTLSKVNRYVREYLLATGIKPTDISVTMLRDVADLANRCEKSREVVIVPTEKGFSGDRYFLVKKSDEGDKYIIYKGKKYEVQGGKAYVEIEGTEYPVTAGVYVDRRKDHRSSLFIKEGDLGSGRIVRYVEYRKRGQGLVKAEVVDRVPEFVEISGKKLRVVRGMDGPNHLRLRAVQGWVDMATTEESLGWTMESLYQLGNKLTTPLWPGECPFISPKMWREYVFTNKELNVGGRMYRLEQIRIRSERASKGHSGSIR